MPAPRGYAILTDPAAARPQEWDTAQCSHCQRVIFLKPGTAGTVYLRLTTPTEVVEEPGAFCVHCMHAICLGCATIGRCVPWERRLEMAESRDRLKRSVGA